MSEEALNCLLHYEWPGNIRELENLIERLCVLKAGEIVKTTDLPQKYRNSPHPLPHSMDIPSAGLDFNHIVKHFENTLILKALTKTRWNRNQAAKLLKLNRTTLLEKIKKKGLKENRPNLLEDTQTQEIMNDAQHTKTMPV